MLNCISVSGRRFLAGREQARFYGDWDHVMDICVKNPALTASSVRKPFQCEHKFLTTCLKESSCLKKAQTNSFLRVSFLQGDKIPVDKGCSELLISWIEEVSRYLAFPSSSSAVRRNSSAEIWGFTLSPHHDLRRNQGIRIKWTLLSWFYSCIPFSHCSVRSVMINGRRSPGLTYRAGQKSPSI